MAFHCFYRNSYHKGVRATVWEDGMADPVWTGDIFASRDLNPGRRFLVAATPQGRIAAAWPNDARKKKEGWTIRTWDHPGQLQQDEVAAPDGWEAKHKNWFVMAGAGAGYAMWNFSSPGPDEEGFVTVPADAADAPPEGSERKGWQMRPRRAPPCAVPRGAGASPSALTPNHAHAIDTLGPRALPLPL